MHLEGKVALVTGAAQGLGKATALKLAEQNASVALIDLKKDLVQQTCEEIVSKSGRAIAYAVDLQNIEQITTTFEQINQDFGRLDVAVNAAGVMQTKPLLEITESDWDFIMDINSKALFFCMQEAAKHMRKVGGGRIINFASVAGRGPRPLAAPYAASKAAVISITRSAAAAFAEYNIKVNAVCPGYVHTPMWDQIDKDRAKIFNQPEGEAVRQMLKQIPLKRAAGLDEIAGLVNFLTSKESDYITGQSINICGGVEMD